MAELAEGGGIAQRAQVRRCTQGHTARPRQPLLTRLILAKAAHSPTAAQGLLLGSRPVDPLTQLSPQPPPRATTAAVSASR